MTSAALLKPRILVVEDEYLIRLTLVEALCDEGFDVIEAANGDTALPLLFADASIRLLMTDIQMPGALNGWQLTDAARKARPDLPVLFMSGRPDGADLVAGSPLNAHIAKPYRLSDLCRAVRGMLGVSPDARGGRPASPAGC